ncbi:helix-turn-helix transcriptional regulator [Paraburkholderia sp. UCT31]|uniref:helix-turn-helix domain-containing protein n=1 Tax=Paraburkholderia sp. UCT31 TaxID=2615209 RepID=UPI0016565286|nr:helix-turn-helix transcriptional regulator [Paraburkholderia sp. UCT31]MBC8737266.1 helix-turn-helix transcriptional regulator [Paraburkholderia sp. UCT31]
MDSLFVDTRVLDALRRLRGASRSELAKAAGVAAQNLNAWLNENEEGDGYVARKNQYEVMRALGIEGDQLRPSVVHHWRVNESYFGGAQAYRDLHIMLKVFGPAALISFQRRTEPLFSLSGTQVFGLRFADARVVLTVTLPYLKPVSLDPNRFDANDLVWAFEGEDPVALIDDHEYNQLLTADITPAEFDDYATGKGDTVKWAKIHLIAREYNVGPDEVHDWITSRARQSENQVALGMNSNIATQKVANGADVPVGATPTPAPAADKFEKSSKSQNSGLARKASVSNLNEFRLFVNKSE